MKHPVRNISILLSNLMILLFSMTSCLKEEPYHEVSQKKGIRLQASVVPSIMISKGEGVLDPSYDADLQIGLARIDENSSAGYPYFDHALAPLKATMKPGSPDINIRDIEFDTYQQFKNEIDYIRYASWYPVGTYDNNSKTVSFDITDGNTDVMKGSIATGNEKNGFNTIYFDHALAKYTFNVYAMVQEDESSQESPENQVADLWGHLKDIQILNMPNECRLTLPLSPDQGDENAYKTSFNAFDKSIHVPKNNPGDEHLLEQLPIGAANAVKLTSLIAAPPEDGVLHINVETVSTDGTAQKISAKTLTIARDFQPGRNYEIYLRFSDHGLINAEVAVGEWQEGNGVVNDKVNNEIYYDLSSYAKSNCYIVTSANYNYCFDVSVRGNGEDGKVDATETSIKPNYIDVIWMDPELEPYFRLDNLNHIPVQNRCLFRITNDASNAVADQDEKKKEEANKNKDLSETGNILIGAYDKKGGTLLWTWHLWITQKPQDQAYKNGFVALDRDLGAKSYDYIQARPTDIDGLYYQWGRPTPLPFRPDASKPQAVTNEGSPFNITTSNENADMLTRIAHPDKFYKTSIATGGNTGTGLDHFYEFWGYDHSTKEYKKTIYDPCPAGYRLPSKSLFRHKEKDIFTFDENHAVKLNVDVYYKMIKPASGYYNFEGDNLVAKNYFIQEKASGTSGTGGAYWWCGTVDQFEENKEGKAYAVDATFKNGVTGEIGVPWPVKHAYTDALPVRCVSERSIPETRNLSSAQTANSYIISRPGFYKFKATVRGNGIWKLSSPGSSESIDISPEDNVVDMSDKLVNVVPLWWQGDLSAPGGNDMPIASPVHFTDNGTPDKNGYVYFDIINYQKGNMIVAGKDNLGNILWTWHLWLTDEPKIHQSNDYAVMDRFLGATSLPTYSANAEPLEELALGSYGLYYQWGRKDPFPKPDGVGGGAPIWWEYNSQTEEWSKRTGLASLTNLSSEKTIVNSISHPTRYHSANEQNVYLYDRFPTTIPTNQYDLETAVTFGENEEYSCFPHLFIHGDPRNSALWGYSAIGGVYGKTSTKTMYDPCPPGYSVAFYLLWRGDGKDLYTYIDSGNMDVTYKTHLKSRGIFLNDYPRFDTTWYPYCGYINQLGNFMKIGQEGRFYTSTPAGDYASRSMVYYNSGGSVWTGQAVQTSSYEGDHVSGIPTTIALPVRCQKD